MGLHLWIIKRFGALTLVNYKNRITDITEYINIILNLNISMNQFRIAIIKFRLSFHTLAI